MCESMQQFIEYIVKNLVDVPEGVDVQCINGQRGTIIEVRVDKADTGKIIGKEGRTIQALRTIAMLTGNKLGRQVRFELIE